MSSYLHPDYQDLVGKAESLGYDLLDTDDFSLMLGRGTNTILVSLPETEIYEFVECEFDFPVTTIELESLGFPL